MQLPRSPSPPLLACPLQPLSPTLTPLSHTQVIAARLLSPADLRSDVLVGQALQAFLTAAAGVGAGAAGAPAAAAAAASLLARLQPSARVLGGLLNRLQGSANGAQGAATGSAGAAHPLLGGLAPATRKHLAAFVSSHVPAVAAGDEGGAEAAAGEQPAAAVGGNNAKRKRALGGAALQRELVALLDVAGAGAGRARRRPHAGASTGTPTHAPGRSSTAAEGSVGTLASLFEAL